VSECAKWLTTRRENLLALKFRGAPVPVSRLSDRLLGSCITRYYSSSPSTSACLAARLNALRVLLLMLATSFDISSGVK
jgi:hypothetical protein